MKRWAGIVLLLFAWGSTYANPDLSSIIADIYNQLVESSSASYPDLEDELLDLSLHPINLNTATADDLRRLYFLSDRQIDDILLYCYEHPIDSLYELQLIHSLHDYDIRNLSAFVYVQPVDTVVPLYARQVFANAQHELLSRLDFRNIEAASSDPVFFYEKYKFNYLNRVRFGLELTRPTGADATRLQFGGYVQLDEIGCLQTLVAGDFQASFGQGLVLASPFHGSKTSLAMNAATQAEGVRRYSSSSSQSLHGLASTFAWKTPHLSWQATMLYSCIQPNDTLFQHLLGANLSLTYKTLHLGLTAVEYLYSDSVRYYRNQTYNERYFRGQRQFVIGAHWRYVYRWCDFFGEFAMAQNEKWGFALQTGARLSPWDNWGIIALYRYYSPWFDNVLGYAYSENSRIQDENGFYLGLECTQVKNLKLNLWGDLFRFQYPKYGISKAPSMGYDAMCDILFEPLSAHQLNFRLRARQKADLAKYSFRFQYNYLSGPWHLRSQFDAAMSHEASSSPSWGISLFQDVQYQFPAIPLTLQLRLQGFDIRQWDNRIYCYENDVLYAFSIPATYGRGGRAYLNARYQINRWLSLYLRFSETVWNRNWALQQGKLCQNQTDIHLLLRAKF